MFGKFLLVLLVAVSCTQGFSNYDRQEVDANKDIIGDIIEKIKSAIAKLGDVIVNLEDKIKEIIADIDIGKIVKNIEEEIKKIIDKVGAAVPKHCIVAAKEAVDSLVVDITDQVATCANSAAENASALISEALSLISEAEGFENDIKARVAKCVKDNLTDPIGLKKCVEKQVEEVKDKVKAMIAQVEKLVEQAQALYTNVTTCVTAVQKDVNDKSNAIIADFQKCIQVPEL